VEISKYLRLEKVVDSRVKFARFGNKFDGGYVMCHDFSETDAMLSLGVGNDVTFDSEMSKLVSKIHLYDHTVDDIPSPVHNALFWKEAIGYVEKGAVTLEEALTRLNPAASVILKMDIEGNEWEVLANTVSLESFKQIVIEFHGLHNLTSIEHFVRMTSTFQKLHAIHAPIHLHANNYAPAAVIGNCLVPDVIEVTYLNRANYNMHPIEPSPGSEFDNPNSPLLPEIALSFPLSSRFDLI
jgi:hypothetical protein